jgi:inosine triphosphate pyrophosphatase
MAAAAARASGLMVSRPVTFVTGNAKKLEEVRAILGNSIPFQSLKLDCKLHSIYSLSLSLSLSNSLFIYFYYFTVPELQGEPEDISKEKARLAAIEVLSLGLLYHMYMSYVYVCVFIYC